MAGECRVRIDAETSSLIWPVMFFYPEHCECDFITSFSENDRFIDHLHTMFCTDSGEFQPAPWDIAGVYNPDKLDVYFETRGEDPVRLCKVGKDMTLGEVLAHEAYWVVDGVPAFFVVVRGSEFAREFRRRYTKKVNKK
ncbi:Tetratricopeptide repeat protein 4 [Quaeritorhiza haematococci]|nr:Tetratricopeptide repeat protein 4 [Quaeritorhiza haematococci]